MGMEGVFWVCVCVISYIYLGYPLLLAARARLAPRTSDKATPRAGRWPSLSIILAARNEADRLHARLLNLLDLDYMVPREIIVVSDGSTDATGAILDSFRGAVKV